MDKCIQRGLSKHRHAGKHSEESRVLVMTGRNHHHLSLSFVFVFTCENAFMRQITPENYSSDLAATSLTEIPYFSWRLPSVTHEEHDSFS